MAEYHVLIRNDQSGVQTERVKWFGGKWVSERVIVADSLSMASRENGSDGLGWADQWDYKLNDDKSNQLAVSGQKPTKKEKLAEMSKKMKVAASTGFAKAKVVASAGAQKAKTGSAAGVRWMKEQYEKRKSSK
ncbi:hypothetical protein R1sor_006354 [Riccia sorocarpa]|uniref:Uncharacterized protein n=1 Tax=Riccia sorocarpa TaxID=122646 RepID=A0ABD3HM62_9MARC